MARTATAKRFAFPRWANYLLPLAFLGAIGGALYAPLIVTFGFSPKTTAVGYAPIQPVEYSHALHAGKLGIDCRYCHNTVEKAAYAAVPATQTCMNCHTNINPNNGVKLTKVKESWATGEPIAWVKIHDLPDYAYFNHASHVNKGVSCISCHGRVDQMEVVYQAEPLSMAWCLDCHRNPAPHLRPKDQVTHLGWKVEDLAVSNPDLYATIQQKNPGQPITQDLLGEFLKKEYVIRDTHYMTACSTCHR